MREHITFFISSYYTKDSLDFLVKTPTRSRILGNRSLGEGTHYDYGFRIYNPRVAKFLSVDPLTKDYPMLTPYQFASNTPIQATDLDGLETSYSFFQDYFSKTFNFDYHKNTNSEYVKEFTTQKTIMLGEVTKTKAQEYMQGVSKSPLSAFTLIIMTAPFAEANFATMSPRLIGSSYIGKQGLDVFVETGTQFIANDFDYRRVDASDIFTALAPFGFEETLQAGFDYSIDRGFKSVLSSNKNTSKSLNLFAVELGANLTFGTASKKLFGNISLDPTFKGVVKGQFDLGTGVANKSFVNKLFDNDQITTSNVETSGNDETENNGN